MLFDNQCLQCRMLLCCFKFSLSFNFLFTPNLSLAFTFSLAILFLITILICLQKTPSNRRTLFTEPLPLPSTPSKKAKLFGRALFPVAGTTITTATKTTATTTVLPCAQDAMEQLNAIKTLVNRDLVRMKQLVEDKDKEINTMKIKLEEVVSENNDLKEKNAQLEKRLANGLSLKMELTNRLTSMQQLVNEIDDGNIPESTDYNFQRPFEFLEDSDPLAMLNSSENESPIHSISSNDSVSSSVHRFKTIKKSKKSYAFLKQWFFLNRMIV